MSDVPWDSPEAQAYFAQEDDNKQRRYEYRITKEILRGLGFQAPRIAELETESSGVDNHDEFTPEWISERLRLFVSFRAVKDFWLNKSHIGFPDPNYLITHQGRRATSKAGNKTWEQVWDELWGESVRRFSDSTYVAVCFRPSWAEETIALHNWWPAVDAVGLKGWMMLYRWRAGPTVLQTLSDLLLAMRSVYRPNT